MCCVEFLVCAKYNGIALVDTEGTASITTGNGGDYSEGWSIDINTFPFVLTASITATADESNVGSVDSMCIGDHVEIPCKVIQIQLQLYYLVLLIIFDYEWFIKSWLVNKSFLS